MAHVSYSDGSGHFFQDLRRVDEDRSRVFESGHIQGVGFLVESRCRGPAVSQCLGVA